MTSYCLAAVALLAIPALASEPSVRTIRVSGEGKATAPPDMATIHTGVVTQAKSAQDAVAENNVAMKRILSALAEHKIAAKDIQTSSFGVRPEYKRGPRGQQQTEIIGYRVTNQVRVMVRDLPDLGQVLDALVAAGSNQVSGVSFGIDDPTGVLNQARNRAISDARSRAALYAHAANVRVGKVISISEQALAAPRSQFVGRAFAADSAGAVPVATGEQELRVTIHMVFALEDLE
jgi:uncharacterized protein YggE